MKKTIITLGLITFSVIGFSQTVISNENNNNTIQKVTTTSTVNKAGLRPVVLGEKIQTIINGVVRYSEDYKPEYPQSMIDPEKQSVNNVKGTKNN